MPYIDSKDVAQIRKGIRAALPNYKISVRKRHNSTVDVTVLSGPIPNVENINVFCYKDHLGTGKGNRPDAIAVIDTIIAEIFKVQEPRTLVEDSDYGNVPTFYYDVKFGAWDKPYVCTDANAEEELGDRLAIRREFNFVEQEIKYQQWKREQPLRLVS